MSKPNINLKAVNDSITKEAFEQSKQESKQIDEQVLSEAEKSVNLLKDMWTNTLQNIDAKFCKTDEDRAELRAMVNHLQMATLETTYHGMTFSEYFNAYMGSNKPLDLPVLYLMNDALRGFATSCTAIPESMQNIHDESFPGGSQDPRWTYKNLPVEKVLDGGGYVHIPVKVETFGLIFWGYLELFEYVKTVDGKPVKVTCSIPAIRVKDQYLSVNAVYRWMQVTDKDVQERFIKGNYKIVKKPKEDNKDVKATSDGLDQRSTEPRSDESTS